MSKQNYLKDAQLNFFRGTAMPTVSGLRVALWRQDGTEASGTGYARQTYGVASGDWNAPANGPGGALQRQITNTTIVDFGTAGADWAPSGNPVTEVRVFDQGGTNTLYRMATDASGASFSKIIQTGDPVRIDAAQLALRETSTL